MSKVITARALKSKSPNGRMLRALVKHSEGKGLKGVLVSNKASGRVSVKAVSGPNYDIDWDSAKGKFEEGHSVSFDLQDFGRGVGVAYNMRKLILRPRKQKRGNP